MLVELNVRNTSSIGTSAVRIAAFELGRQQRLDVGPLVADPVGGIDGDELATCRRARPRSAASALPATGTAATIIEATLFAMGVSRTARRAGTRAARPDPRARPLPAGRRPRRYRLHVGPDGHRRAAAADRLPGPRRRRPDARRGQAVGARRAAARRSATSPPSSATSTGSRRSCTCAGIVCATPEFDKVHHVVGAANALIGELFGDDALGGRTAIGVATLAGTGERHPRDGRRVTASRIER